MQQKIITPFTLRYDGGLAEGHVIDAQELGISLVGATKFYDSVVQYCLSGNIPTRNYRKGYGCYTQAAEHNCYEQWVFVAPLALQYGILADGAREAVSLVFLGIRI